MIVIDFIASNYIWFLIAAIMAVLAIIGKYAEKTNFGQGENTKITIEEEPPTEKSIDYEAIKGKRINGDSVVPKQTKDSNVHLDESQVKLLSDGQYVLVNTDSILGQVDTVETKPVVGESLNSQHTETEEKLKKVEELKKNITKLGLKYIDVNQIISKPIKINDNFNNLSDKLDVNLSSGEVVDSDILDEIDNLQIDNIDKSLSKKSTIQDTIDLSDLNISVSNSKKIWKK